MIKMVRFRDLVNEAILGGILLDDGTIICGCCGGLIEKDDPNFEIIEELEWGDISAEILNH